jgi:FAD/FMN-containing dehydrogenase
VITAAVLKLFPAPISIVTAFAAIGRLEDALSLLGILQSRLGPALTAFEVMSDQCLELVRRHNDDLRLPVGAAPWFVLVEASHFSANDGAADDLQAILAEAFEAGAVLDAAVATSLRQGTEFWALRENISEAQAREGHAIKHDVSVPISQIPAFVAKTMAALATRHSDARFVIFGHVGDGNLHFNLSPPIGDKGVGLLARQDEINRIVHDLVHAHGGSISAEHGLGVLRRDEAERYKTPVELKIMRAIKRALDPRGIMNPGKVLRSHGRSRPLDPAAP